MLGLYKNVFFFCWEWWCGRLFEGGRLLTFWAVTGRLFEGINIIRKLLVGRWPLIASGIGLQAVVIRLSWHARCDWSTLRAVFSVRPLNLKVSFIRRSMKGITVISKNARNGKIIPKHTRINHRLVSFIHFIE